MGLPGSRGHWREGRGSLETVKGTARHEATGLVWLQGVLYNLCISLLWWLGRVRRQDANVTSLVASGCHSSLHLVKLQLLHLLWAEPVPH